MDEPSKPLPFSTSISRWFFAACIILVLYGAFLLVEAYLIPIFLALATVVVAAPLYEFSQRLLGGRNRLASALTCLILLFIIVLPMFWLVGMLTGQALELYTTVSQQVTGDRVPGRTSTGAWAGWPPWWTSCKRSWGWTSRRSWPRSARRCAG